MNLLDWKVIVTVVVTLIALLVALGNHPAVKGFFAAVSEKLPALPESRLRNVSFSAVLDSQQGMAVATKRKINVTLNASAIDAVAKEVNVNGSDKRVRVIGYEGFVSLNASRYEINGSFERFEVDDVFVIRGPVYAAGVYEEAWLDGLALEEYKGGSGVVLVDGNEIKFSEITIESPLGDFVFSDRLRVTGVASRIVIGKITIS